MSRWTEFRQGFVRGYRQATPWPRYFIAYIGLVIAIFLVLMIVRNL